ncbi:hypothetical protein [Candidatus Williamhamiltonella defendens]|uniref:hypothetical protein n=1 Tax=Candidatus Williamhamiltonella defendens TaxID=138072 RepID=UPI001F208D8C|nr:hypothetical protein [Candidatus Hamiltonella defensa]
MINIDLVILGAGIEEIDAALNARETEIKYEIFELNPSADELLYNFNIEGFRFDNAVHLSFSIETKVRIIFDKTPYIKHLPYALNF